MIKILTLMLLFLTINTTINANVSCPLVCQCTIDGLNFIVDCSNQGLSELPTFDYKLVHFLDLSNNKFSEFPGGVRELQGLEYLDISYNQISSIPENALQGLSSLGVFDVSYNNISHWAEIHPNFVLEPVVQLRELILAGNKFTSMTSLDENLLLISKSLRLLDLSHCQIAKVSGEFTFVGMEKLEKVSFRGNPLHTLTDLYSESLGSIDLSGCKLEILSPTTFENLPKLNVLNLSHNSKLSLQQGMSMVQSLKDVVHSMSVTHLDLSYCNMEDVELDGFPNLTSVGLGFNMINYLSRDSFTHNRRLEVVDLKANSISHITSDTFRQLSNLRDIDLSYNSISNVGVDIFKHNKNLLSVNFAQNFLQKLVRFNAPSLTRLNVTGCEIINLDRDTIGAMPRLTDLDLSYNLISELPPYLNSHMLQTLNLQNNRLMKITNLTFYHLPELTRLVLAGNRLTNPLRREFFQQNRFMNKLWLGDNPWICDCERPEFFDFYQYLTEPPVKIADRNNLKCYSPEEAYGQFWEGACYLKWYPNDRRFGLTEKIWMGVMVAVVVCVGLFCCYKTVQRGLKGRERTRREREREENMTEAEDIARQTRIRLQQEALLNAPDPREHNPPAYEDAIRMPKPLFQSLDELSTRRSRRKRRGQKDEEDEERQETRETSLRSYRFRSEEVLSPRTSRIPPRLHPFELEALERSRTQDEFSPQSPLDELEEFRSFDSQNASPYTKRRGEDSRRASPFKRRDTDRANKHKANDRIASLEDLRQDSTSTSVEIINNIRPSDVVRVTLKRSHDNVEPLPGPSMSPEASKCLEEEFQMLDEQIQASMKTLPSCSSSSNEIEVISSEDIERVSTTQEFVVVDRNRTDNR